VLKFSPEFSPHPSLSVEISVVSIRESEEITHASLVKRKYVTSLDWLSCMPRSSDLTVMKEIQFLKNKGHVIQP
jgi:hypothetical protein